MKSEEFIKRYGHLGRESLPTDARQLLEADPAIEQAFARVETQGMLLRLKAYERPDEALEGRLIYKVRTRLEAGESLDVPELRPGLGFYGLRFGGAALAFALAFGIYTQVMPPANQPNVVGAQPAPDINDQFAPIATSTSNSNGIFRIEEPDGTLVYENTNSNLRLPRQGEVKPINNSLDR